MIYFLSYIKKVLLIRIICELELSSIGQANQGIGRTYIPLKNKIIIGVLNPINNMFSTALYTIISSHFCPPSNNSFICIPLRTQF